MCLICSLCASASTSSAHEATRQCHNNAFPDISRPPNFHSTLPTINSQHQQPSGVSSFLSLLTAVERNCLLLHLPLCRSDITPHVACLSTWAAQRPTTQRRAARRAAGGGPRAAGRGRRAVGGGPHNREAAASAAAQRRAAQRRAT